MARVILCETKIAKKPFCFPSTGQNLYSYEELCYYIQQYPALFQEDFVTESLINWLREEIEANSLADQLVQLKRENVQTRIYVLTILEAYPYLSTRIIKDIIKHLDYLYLKDPWFQKKEYADALYQAGYVQLAKKLYDCLVDEIPKTEENKKPLGEVWHARGCCFAKDMQYQEAAYSFKQAVTFGGHNKSRKKYWLALYLNGEEETIKKDIEAAALPIETYTEFLKEIKEKEAYCQYNRDYRKLEQVEDLWRQGSKEEYQKKIRELTEKWKFDYRDEVK